MHCTRLAAAALVIGLSVSTAEAPLRAQSAFSDPSLQALQQQNEQILAELKAMRQLLERLLAGQPGGGPPPAPRVSLSNLPLEHALGSPDAPLTMVEFTDLQCPFCRQFHLGAFEELKRAYIDTGKLRFVSRDLPIAQLHPLAFDAARASRCAAAQNKYWEMRHAILANNAQLTAALFPGLARELGLDVDAFSACTSNTAPLDAAIRADIAEAMSAGINATPGFVLGVSKGTGVDGLRVSGALPFSAFDSAIKQMLGLK